MDDAEKIAGLLKIVEGEYTKYLKKELREVLCLNRQILIASV